ncbi:MAG: HD domain-containing protein [Candidatus Altiarchaeales archaeon]|nr:HD domain-containing protein [Candidatus Altiarchaeota archaeon]MBU4437436.1 HD domain-containing protein [Candidatus Altiarchaeota archaeon]MCG2782845.1 HD domain-containing protein [Candidatus Altiarchaeales archaeon]
MKPVKTIRDPIHGTIVLSELELELIDTPQLQRLRHIKQNGLCYLIYPAMNSTRFEHSLGVMQLAKLAGKHLGLDDDETIKLGIAGLLHDIGHCAFSHTSDEILLRMGHHHEENSSHIIENTEISDILGKNGIEPKDVSDLIHGRGNLAKVISSEIDVDKMDYLIRDAYYAGVAYGVIDLERIIYGMKIVDGDMVIERRSLEAVESLLISRNMMYQTVYRHHTKRIAEAMFRHALVDMMDNKKLSYEEFIQLDDIDLVYRMRSSGGYSEEITRRIDERKLFKIVFQEHISAIEENFREDMNDSSTKIEDAIAKDFGIEKGYVLLDMPETKLSEFKVLVDFEGELKRIDEVSSLAKSLEKSEQEKMTFCIYAPKKETEKFKKFNPEKYIEFSQTRLAKFV